MTDLERLGKHVGGQHAIEFWALLRELGLQRSIEPNFSALRDDTPASVYRVLRFASLCVDRRLRIPPIFDV